MNVLVVSAHPDDAELACSGTVRILADEGAHVVFVECTRGELGTRGTVEIREREAQAAAAILGVHTRECVDMPDGHIVHTTENINKLVYAIRKYQPQLMLIPPPYERHPDHEAVHRLCRTAAFMAGLGRIETYDGSVAQLPHRPKRMLCFMQHYEFPKPPDVYVDISAVFETRMASVRAFASQFHIPDAYTSNEPATYISRPQFLEELEARARYFGGLIGTNYAEAFLAVEPVAVASLSHLL